MVNILMYFFPDFLPPRCTQVSDYVKPFVTESTAQLQKIEFKELSVNSPATTNQVKKQHLPPPPTPREHSRFPPGNGNSPVYGTLCFSL